MAAERVEHEVGLRTSSRGQVLLESAVPELGSNTGLAKYSLSPAVRTLDGGRRRARVDTRRSSPCFRVA